MTGTPRLAAPLLAALALTLAACGATREAEPTAATSTASTAAARGEATPGTTPTVTPTIVVASRSTTGDAPASATPLGLRAPAGVRAGVAMPSPDRTPGLARPLGTAEVCALPAAEPEVPPALQQQAFNAYGIAPAATYQVDRLIPALLGGSDEIANLWPQPATPTPGSREKDRLEVALRDLVCSGALDLPTAQREVARDWYSAYQARVATPVTPTPVR